MEERSKATCRRKKVQGKASEWRLRHGCGVRSVALTSKGSCRRASCCWAAPLRCTAAALHRARASRCRPPRSRPVRLVCKGCSGLSCSTGGSTRFHPTGVLCVTTQAQAELLELHPGSGIRRSSRPVRLVRSIHSWRAQQISQIKSSNLQRLLRTQSTLQRPCHRPRSPRSDAVILTLTPSLPLQLLSWQPDTARLSRPQLPLLLRAPSLLCFC